MAPEFAGVDLGLAQSWLSARSPPLSARWP